QPADEAVVERPSPSRWRRGTRCRRGRDPGISINLVHVGNLPYIPFKSDEITAPARTRAICTNVAGLSFDRDRLRRVARLLDIGADPHRRMIGDQLHWYGIDEGSHGRGHRWQC